MPRYVSYTPKGVDLVFDRWFLLMNKPLLLLVT